MLEVEELTKVYRGGVRANDGISLTAGRGEVLGLLGHNGAGKTTLINQVVGLARPTSGRVRVDGRDAVAEPEAARRRCAVQPQTQAPLEGLAPRRAVELMARIRGAGRRRARERAATLLAALDIEAWAATDGDQLSGGVQRLTTFAMTAAEPGDVVMLDEPTNDVDPVRRRLLWQQVRLLADEGCAVLLVTHNVLEAERAVDRLVVLDRGRVVAQGTPADLRGGQADLLQFEVTAVDEQGAARTTRHLQDGLEPRSGQSRSEERRLGSPGAIAVASPVVSGRRVRMLVGHDTVPQALAWAQDARAAGEVEEFSVTPVSLEDVYVRLVGAGHGSADTHGTVKQDSAVREGVSNAALDA